MLYHVQKVNHAVTVTNYKQKVIMLNFSYIKKPKKKCSSRSSQSMCILCDHCALSLSLNAGLKKHTSGPAIVWLWCHNRISSLIKNYYGGMTPSGTVLVPHLVEIRRLCQNLKQTDMKRNCLHLQINKNRLKVYEQWTLAFLLQK